jgi:hypothetical protein
MGARSTLRPTLARRACLPLVDANQAGAFVGDHPIIDDRECTVTHIDVIPQPRSLGKTEDWIVVELVI